jgi:hypothetical protein
MIGFITELDNVYCLVQTGSSNKQYSFVLKDMVIEQKMEAVGSCN